MNYCTYPYLSFTCNIMPRARKVAGCGHANHVGIRAFVDFLFAFTTGVGIRWLLGNLVNVMYRLSFAECFHLEIGGRNKRTLRKFKGIKKPCLCFNGYLLPFLLFPNRGLMV